jgi:uncharacterized SAM-binding protein YcdF (DUF218 family)
VKLRRLVEWLGAPLVVRSGWRELDAVVGLGSALTADGGLTVIGDERVRATVEVWRRGGARIVCFSGGRTRGGRVSEASVMGEAARALGVPGAALRLEEDAQNTEENARKTAALLRADGVRRVWVVSQPFHLRRSVLWFRRAGLEAHGWWIDESLQFREPRRGLRWVAREYLSLTRDILFRGDTLHVGKDRKDS